MPLDYVIEPEQALIKVTVHGKLDYLSLDKLWKDIVAACRAHECTRILGIANVDAPSSSDAYDHASVFAAAGLSSKHRIAWVEQNPEAMELASLAEAVIRNRDLATPRTFSSENKARNWLSED